MRGCLSLVIFLSALEKLQNLDDKLELLGAKVMFCHPARCARAHLPYDPVHKLTSALEEGSSAPRIRSSTITPDAAEPDMERSLQTPNRKLGFRNTMRTL